MRFLNLFVSAVLVTIILGFSCRKGSEDSMPEIVSGGSQVSVYGDISQGTLQLGISLSSAAKQVVSLSYSTMDSTAIAGQDYVAVQNGTITFQPGEKANRLKSQSCQILREKRMSGLK